ncbi:hypothetical protein OAS39_01030 [Pirellulales bacterium]|nr:hypothetical protein [Pirellulales bacterium]
MQIAYSCSSCDTAVHDDFDNSTERLTCPHCGQQAVLPEDAIRGDAVKRCLVCPSADLYIRKDFPQRLGVLLVAIGVVGSCIAYHYGRIYWAFGMLFISALADVLLYACVGNALMCYRCGALYRDVDMDVHPGFDLETHERHRQIAARMGASGT